MRRAKATNGTTGLELGKHLQLIDGEKSRTFLSNLADMIIVDDVDGYKMDVSLVLVVVDNIEDIDGLKKDGLCNQMSLPFSYSRLS